MANPAALELHLAKFRTGARPLRFTRVLGRDWKIAFLFVLPMVLIMAGLIFWPFISAILTEHDGAQLHHRRDRSTSASATTSGCSPTATTCCRCKNTISLHLLVARHQVRRRHDDRADPQQPRCPAATS